MFQATLTGMAKKFYHGWILTERGKDWFRTTAASRHPADFAVPLYDQFCGDFSCVGDKARETAKANIYALKIYQMKYFEEYVNEFQEYYCTIGEFENEDLVLFLYRKLPEP